MATEGSLRVQSLVFQFKEFQIDNGFKNLKLELLYTQTIHILMVVAQIIYSTELPIKELGEFPEDSSEYEA